MSKCYTIKAIEAARSGEATLVAVLTGEYDNTFAKSIVGEKEILHLSYESVNQDTVTVPSLI